MTEVTCLNAPRIVSVATAVPRFRISQTQIKEICRAHFRSLPHIERLLEVVDHAGVEYRHFCFPPDYYLGARDFQSSNRDFVEQAVALGSQAVREALEGEPPTSIDHVIGVTTTGVATPSIEAHLYNHLGLRSDIFRTPLFGTGCAGGVNALAHADVFGRAHPDSRTLVLAVELCGQTFQQADRSTRNLIATSLFGDGVAAVLVDGPSRSCRGPEILGTGSELIADSLDVMGWDVTEHGLELVLSPKVPSYVRDFLPGMVTRFLCRHGRQLSDVDYFVFHPGGPKILQAYKESLHLPAEALRFSSDVLRCHGNISSASVLFVLKDVMKHASPAKGALGLLAAMGPGFAAELALVRF